MTEYRNEVFLAQRVQISPFLKMLFGDFELLCGMFQTILGFIEWWKQTKNQIKITVCCH